MDLQTQVEKKLCEDEHLYFTRRFFKPRMGFKFMVNWHHVYISWIIDQVIAGKIDNVVINVPPGAGKTELTTNLIPRGLALNARSKFLYLSFSQSLVEGVSDTARDIVKSKNFTQMWGLSVSNSTDSKKEWKITVDDYDVGHVYVASMGGQVTGTLDSPLLMTGNGSSIVIQIENAKGLGINIERLNAGKGVLFERGLTFKVVSVDMVDQILIYTLLFKSEEETHDINY